MSRLQQKNINNVDGMTANEIIELDKTIKTDIEICDSNYLILHFKLKDKNNRIYSFNSKTNIIKLVLILILFIASMITVALLQNDNFNLIIDENYDQIEAKASLCNIIDFSNFNIIQHPFGFILIIIYSFSFFRKSCCLKCCFKRPALPLVTSPFKKYDRLKTSIVYGIMAYEVTDVIDNVIFKTSASDTYGTLVQDPTGLFKFLMRLLEVLVVSIRYYPPLIALYANSLFIYITSSFYMLVDLGNNIYVEGKLHRNSLLLST